MWVLSVQDFLKMSGVPPMHQELKAQGLLVEAQPSFLVLCVSHQWLGGSHPDATGAQTGVLRSILRNIIEGHTEVETTMADQFHGYQRHLPSREQLKQAYIWFDWFSVPQVVGATPENRETVLIASRRSIRSIPAYVDASQVFVALVPRLPHNDTGRLCNHSTWHRRGWCRLEMWCKLLSERDENPVVVAYGDDSAQFAAPMDQIHFYVHEGDFSVESDRQTCGEVVQKCLDFRLANLALGTEFKQRELYRFFAARYEDFAGLPVPSRTPREFLTHFRFGSQELAVQQKTGMGPIACAAASGDIEMIRYFAQAGASLHTRCFSMQECDVESGATPLHLAARRGPRSRDALKELLKLRSDPNAAFGQTRTPLSYISSPESVDLLIEHRADVNMRVAPLWISPLTSAACFGAPVEALAKLVEARADVNLCSGGAGLPVLAGIAMSRICPHAVETAELLVKARADVDLRFQPGGPFRALELISRGYAKVTMRKEIPFALKWFGEVTSGSTALGVACFCGNEDMVEFLLLASADPDSRNNRGHTPVQLARHTHTRRVLEDFVGASVTLQPTLSKKTAKLKQRHDGWAGGDQPLPLAMSGVHGLGSIGDDDVSEYMDDEILTDFV